MKKYMRTGKIQQTPMSKVTHAAKPRLLQKLTQAAKNARNRVSGYSDERRSHLEECARGLIKGADPKQVCRP
jgi:hypothetical protein